MNISLVGMTRKRPKLLQRMFDSAISTAKYPDLIEMSMYVDKDDIDTQKHLETMKGNIKVTIGNRITMSDMPNKAYEKATADIIMGCGDDLIFRTQDWDEKVINVFSQYEDKIVFVHPNDLIQGEKMGAVMFLHRKWIETLGYFIPPYFSCDYGDTWLTQVADALDRRIYLPDVIIQHMHFSVGTGELDKTHKERLDRCKRDDVGQLYSSLEYKRQIDVQKLINAINSHKGFVDKFDMKRLDTTINIGLAVITYNRLGYLKQCVNALEKNNWGGANLRIIVDDCSTQEGYNEFLLSLEPNITILRNSKNSGVATSKNKALEQMFESGCEHLFTMEDDIIMKSQYTCLHYMNYAKANDLKHLNFGLHGPANKDKGYYNLKGIWVYPDCIGAFSYYHKDIVENIGYMDIGFKNAWEHVWHTLQIAEAGYTTPFWQFADVPNSHELLDEIPGSISNSIIRQGEDWLRNMKNGVSHAINKYGKWLPPRKDAQYLADTNAIHDIQIIHGNMQDIRYITVVNNFDTLGRALFESPGVNSDNIVIIDNTRINNPISCGYNQVMKNLLKDPKQEWLAFCHQDFYMRENLLLRLSELDKNCIYGPIGVSSLGYFGRIIQTNGRPIGKVCNNCVVDTIDAMCILVHKDAIREYDLSFDENFKYHFYVEDFCLQARTKGILTKTLQTDCQHRSRTMTGDLGSSEFRDSRNILVKKWQSARTTTGLHTLDFKEFDIENMIEMLEKIRHSNWQD